MSGLRIRTDVTSLMAMRHLGVVNDRIVKGIERVSSGLRIVRAGDDSAGFAISERLRTQTNGLDQAGRNAQDAVSLLQTMQGGLGHMANLLQRLRVLAVQAANDTASASDRVLLENEANSILAEIQRTATSTNFNDKTLLDGRTRTTDNANTAASSTGSALGAPWTVLTNAISNLDSGTDQTVDFTVSFMKVGNSTEDGPTTDAEDQVDGSPNDAGFQSDVMAAFGEWKSLFERIYSRENGSNANLTINFTNIGVETGTTTPSDPAEPSYGAPFPDGAGDFRVGMAPIDGAMNILAHGFSPSGTPGVTGNVGGDLHFDTAEDWRLDGTSDPGAFSVKMVAAHEIGHAMGLGHDADPNSIMFAIIGVNEDFDTKFAGGLSVTATDAGSVMNRYGIPNEATPDELIFHVGANENETITVNTVNVMVSKIGLATVDLSTRIGAENSLTDIESAIDIVTARAAEAGASQNRVDRAFDFVGLSRESQVMAESRIRDLNYVDGISELTKDRILQESGSSALIQSNISTMSVLRLLGAA